MKDIKELIYAAIEENALKFQEIVNSQLQVRAYDAIEALRPEIGASMFGEAKKMEDDEEEMEDEDEEDEEMEDEDEMDDKKKSMKEALHPNQQKIDVVDDEKIDAKDFAKLRKMKKGNVQENVREYLNQKGTGKSAEGYDDAGTFDRQTAEKHAAKHGGKVVPDPSGKHLVKLPGKRPIQSGKTAVAKFLQSRKGDGKVRTEEVVNEVAMPKNQADWQALITHQIQTVGHPVATDAQFRAQHGKDMSKPASLEPGEDKLQYATAQGGTVKQ